MARADVDSLELHLRLAQGTAAEVAASLPDDDAAEARELLEIVDAVGPRAVDALRDLGRRPRRRVEAEAVALEEGLEALAAALAQVDDDLPSWLRVDDVMDRVFHACEAAEAADARFPPIRTEFQAWMERNEREVGYNPGRPEGSSEATFAIWDATEMLDHMASGLRSRGIPYDDVVHAHIVAIADHARALATAEPAMAGYVASVLAWLDRVRAHEPKT